MTEPLNCPSLKAARLTYARAALHLARAFLLSGQADPAVLHFHAAIDHGLSEAAEPQLPFLMQEAERIVLSGDQREAIQRWQDIAALLGAATPSLVYQKLSAAYAANDSGFGGSREENFLWGDCSKHDLLQWLVRWLQPSLYFEIGVDEGLSLACAEGRAIGVDPRTELRLRSPLPPAAQIVPCSSDEFFADHARSLLRPAPELAFIDGMHLLEFVLRDLYHTEQYMAPWGLVVIDDIYPCHPVQAQRRRRSGAWTGDVWKLVPLLRRYRPDLTLLCLNAHTTGLLLIAGLDASNREWMAHAAADVPHYRRILEPPTEVLERHGAIPSDHPLVRELLHLLHQARRQRLGVHPIQRLLAPLRLRISEAEAWHRGLARAESRRGCVLPDPERA